MNNNKTDLRVNHVALVLSDVEFAADFMRASGFNVGPIEVFENEGTKEVYIEKASEASLLLMEPIKEGSYQKSLQKRGPGLHHIAIDVLDLPKYVEGLIQAGWRLHPNSYETMPDHGVAWLSRPGFPALIEVAQVEALRTAYEFMGYIHLQTSKENQGAIDSLGLELFIFPVESPTEFLLDGQYYPLTDFLKPR